MLLRILTDRRLRTVLATCGMGFIVVTILIDGIPTEGLSRLSLSELAVVSLLSMASAIAMAWAWSLLSGREFVVSGLGYLQALPAKQIPGGVGLPIAQLSFETRMGDQPRQVFLRLCQSFLISVGGAGLALVAMEAFSGSVNGVRIAIGAALMTAVLFAHPAILPRLLRRVAGDVPPAGKRVVLVVWLISAVAVSLTSQGFAVVLDAIAAPLQPEAAGSGFALAWVVGFIAVPVPAGIGLRESILIAAFPDIPVATAILASVVLRIIAVGVELILAGFARGLAARHQISTNITCHSGEVQNAPAIRPHAALDHKSREVKAAKIVKLLDSMTVLEGGHVLDVGTGAGYVAAALAAEVGDRGWVIGVDVVDFAERVPGFTFMKVSSEELPIEDHEADVIISNHVIEHLPSRRAQVTHLREIHRALAQTGVLYLATPWRWALVEPHYGLPFLSWLPKVAADRYVRLSRRGERYDVLPLSRARLFQMLKCAGLDYRSVHVEMVEATHCLESNILTSIASRFTQTSVGAAIVFAMAPTTTVVGRILD
jgi:SAM-dependent methyltransferase